MDAAEAESDPPAPAGPMDDESATQYVPHFTKLIRRADHEKDRHAGPFLAELDLTY